MRIRRSFFWAIYAAIRGMDWIKLSVMSRSMTAPILPDKRSEHIGSVHQRTCLGILLASDFLPSANMIR